ncbi:MAG TPA: type IV secretion system DNA-binding domain-containing protein [Candidatus Saccharimonadales bacterium]|nr:type IV secretion system DNA-binding domain-containing protein [Candidatus Saccharimonadales bacterium]
MQLYAYINIGFIGLFLLGAIYFWQATRRLRVKQNVPLLPVEAGQSKLLSIAVPRNNERTPQAAEQLFAALHGIFRTNAEAQPSISFEIANTQQNIVFYIHVPTDLKDFVLSQIYSQYPNIDVKELSAEEDYAKFSEGNAVAATELTLKRPSTYPIKTFQNFEVDPLSGVTGVLSSAGEGESLWVQTIIRPVDDDWQDQGETEIKNIKKPPKHKHWPELIREKSLLFVLDFGRAVFTGKVAEPEKKEEKKDNKEELTGSQQQAVKGIEEKITKLGFEVVIRLVAIARDPNFATAKLEQLIGAYKQYNSINLNSFVSKEISHDPAAIDLYQARAIGAPDMLFNITELASIYHFPSQTVATPQIAWSGSKKGEPPANLPIIGSVPADELTVFAKVNFRAKEQKFGIKKPDRRLHSYIIGKTGTGKSTLMENMIFDDIREGRGVAVVDPHGELIDHILDFIPEERVNDVVYFSPADYHFPIGFNVLEYVDPEMRNVVASGVVGIFKKIFGESWGPRLEYILRNSVLALLESPNSTLLGVMRILTDNAYRRQVISNVNDPVVKDFFINEFEKYEPKFRQEAIAPIQNKVGQFTSSSTIRNIVGQPKSAFDIRQVMDGGKILLADLSTGKIGEDNSALLGAMLITKIQLAAMSRTNMAEEDRRDFYLYVDEFQNFATDSFATILSEARKYRLNLVMINQYISQMPETVANAVFGNVGTMIAFRVGSGDAEAMKNEFQPVFDVNDLVNLPNRQIYLKMAIDGVTVPAFSAATLPPPEEKARLKDLVIERSREQYATARADVEDYITDWSVPVNLSLDEDKKTKSLKQDWERIVTPKPTPVLPTAPVISESEVPANGALVLEHQPVEQAESEPASAPKNLDDRGVPVEERSDDQPANQPADRGVVSEKPKEPLTGRKLEMLSDRFNRKWYSVSSPTEAGELSGGGTLAGPNSVEVEEPKVETTVQENQNTEPQPVQSGGVGETSDENGHLITWDKADELGLKLPNTTVDAKAPIDDFQPIDEL